MSSSVNSPETLKHRGGAGHDLNDRSISKPQHAVFSKPVDESTKVLDVIPTMFFKLLNGV